MKKILIILALILLCSCSKKESNVIVCPEFYKNTYKIVFDSQGGSTVESIKICSTCENNETSTLPEPTRKGYEFGGWYYDEIFLSKADVKTVDELELKRYQDKKGCDIKIKDINLYALWIEK